MTPYWVISVTSPYELYMWKVIFLCDGETWVAHLPQAIDTSIKSYLPTSLSCWQALLAALVQMSRYVMIFSILYSIVSVIKVPSSKIQRGWPTTKTSTLETSEKKKRKSCCVSKSFGSKVESFEELKEAVVTHCLNAAEKIREDEQLVKSVIVFIRTSPFDKHLFLSRSEKIDLAILTDDSMILSRACIDALKKIFAKGYRYQKAGVVFLGLVNNNEYGQNLFVDKSSQKSNSLMKAIDSMNVKSVSYTHLTLPTSDLV